MANYQTQLKDWGVSGAEYPDSYNYEDNKPPVDAWDNFLMDNIITDIQHLLTLTNKRIESDKQTSKPSSPEPGHLFYHTDTGSYYWFDAATASWSRFLDATGDSMSGTLKANAGVKVDSNITDSASNVVYDFENSHVPSEIVEKDGLNADLLDGKSPQEISTSILEDGSKIVDSVVELNFEKDFNVTDIGGGAVNVDAETIPNTHVDVEDSGKKVSTDPPSINLKGHLNATKQGDGDVDIDPSHNHDSRYVNEGDVEPIPDTHVGVENNGTEVAADPSHINFGGSLNATQQSDGDVDVGVETIPNTHVDVENDGTEVSTDPSHLNFQGHLNAIKQGDGDIHVDPSHNHDSRYYTQSEVQTWVNNNADVPNASTVDTVNDNGNTIHVQSSAPNNPSNGDIWINNSQ